jgi:hypothetical protein
LDHQFVPVPRDRVVDLLPMAQSAAVDISAVRFCPHVPDPFVSCVTAALSARKRRFDTAVDYKTHYYANRRAFFILFGLFTPVDVVDSLLKGAPHFLALGPAYFIGRIVYFAELVTAAITRNERYHEFYAVFFLLQTAVMSFLIFQTLV